MYTLFIYFFYTFHLEPSWLRIWLYFLANVKQRGAPKCPCHHDAHTAARVSAGYAVVKRAPIAALIKWRCTGMFCGPLPPSRSVHSPSMLLRTSTVVVATFSSLILIPVVLAQGNTTCKTNSLDWCVGAHSLCDRDTTVLTVGD